MAANGVPKQQPNADFHALLQTLHKFVTDPEGPGCLPLTSTLPDMKTDTESYVKLQRLYKEWSGVENVGLFECFRTQNSIPVNVGQIQRYPQSYLSRFTDRRKCCRLICEECIPYQTSSR